MRQPRKPREPRPDRSKRKNISFAVRWLGMVNMKHKLVVRAAAEALNLAAPERKDQWPFIFSEFYNTFKNTKSPSTSRMKLSRASRPFTGGKCADYNGDVNAPEFLLSYEWRKTRMVALKQHGARCQCCGATAKSGVQIHVDHIKPRRKYPELALTVSNLQILCEVCNHGKGSWDETDWRTDSHTSGESSEDSPVTRTGDDERVITQSLRPRLVRRT